MVQRIIKVQDTVPANTADHVLGSIDAPSSATIETLELWTDGGASREFSVSFNERRIVESVEGEHAPTRDERLVFELRVESGDDLTVLATNSDAADAEMTVYFLIDER